MVYEIKEIRDCPARAIGLDPYELLKEGNQIATDSNWDSPRYLINLKKRLESGKKFNWITKFKAKWFD